jgi:hypothetical protein
MLGAADMAADLLKLDDIPVTPDLQRPPARENGPAHQ